MSKIWFNQQLYPEFSIILIACVFFLGGARRKQNKVCIKNNCFYVELAARPSERARGLMFRKQLAYNKGMLFLFEEEKQHSFWMKNTYIPLDILWIDKDKKIVFIKKKAEPCGEDLCQSIAPDKKARYVLELNAGVADDTGLNIGDTVVFHLIRDTSHFFPSSTK